MTEIQVFEGNGEEPFAPAPRHRVMVRCRTDVNPGWLYFGSITQESYESLQLAEEMPAEAGLRELDIPVATDDGPRQAIKATLGPSTPEGILRIFADDFVAASVLEKKWGTLLTGADLKQRKIVAQLLENQEQYMKDKMP